MIPFIHPGVGPLLGASIGIDIQVNAALGLIQKEDDGSLLLTFNNVEKPTWNTDDDIGVEGEWSPGKLERMWGRVSGGAKQEATISATVDDETVAVDILVGAPDYDDEEDNISFQVEIRQDEPDSLTGLAGENLTDIRMNIDSPDASKGDILVIANAAITLALIKKAVKSGGYDVPPGSALTLGTQWPLTGYDDHILAIMGTNFIIEMMEHARDSQWKGPILAFNSSFDAELVAKRAGACDFLIMPFKADHLLVKIEHCID